MILRRLGTSPKDREAACVACANCPDVFELEDGDFAVIGKDETPILGQSLPPDAGYGDHERIVRVPRDVLLAAGRELPSR